MKKLPFRIPSSVKLQVHSLTSFCIKMYVDMACIVMYDNISKQEVKGLTKKLYFVTLFRMKTSFHAKVQVCGSHGLSVMTDMACIIMYC